VNHYKSKFINLYIANKVLCISVLISVLILISLSQLTSKTQISFIGLTDSKQHKLSYKYPVQVKKVHIIPGQQVKKGHLLIEVQQPELEVQISTLNNEVEFLINEFKLSKEIATQKKFINSDFKKYNSDPQVLLISSKNKQLEYLYSQKRKQKYYADFDGFVDNVFFKSGEIVPAFTPIAQISPTSPNYAKIYLLEGYHDQLSLNEEVTVSSLVSQYKVGAQVINLGKSIIQIPTRLQITPQIIQWGREATIDLPANNKFILGEKIHITNQSKKIFIKDARAKIVPTKNTETIKYDNKKNSITNVDTNNSGIYQFKSSSKDLNFKLLDLKNKNNLFPKLSKHFTEGLYRALSTKPPIYRMNLLKEFKIARKY